MQTLFPAAFAEGISFVRTFAGSNAIHLGQLPGGGFCRLDGQAIQDEEEIRAVIPHGKLLVEALEWWAHRDDDEPEWEPPAVTWKKGRLVYVENGAELTSHAEILQAYPDNSPFQEAALEWFADRQHTQYQARHNQDFQTGVIGKPAVAAVVKKSPKPKGRPRGKGNSHKAKAHVGVTANGSHLQSFVADVTT